MQYPLEEKIGIPELFVGREREFQNYCCLEFFSKLPIKQANRENRCYQIPKTFTEN